MVILRLERPWDREDLSLGAKGLLFLIYSTHIDIEEILKTETDPNKYEYLQESINKNLITREGA
jgi:glutathionylspermidine synthase